jgi:carbon storage regulator
MIILTRRVGEAILIGDDIKVNILKLIGKQIRLGITVPSDMLVLRGELQRWPRKTDRVNYPPSSPPKVDRRS